MSKNTKILLSVLIVALIAIGIFYLSKNKKGTQVIQNPSSLAGCYIYTQGKDIYTLEIQRESEGKVSGRLAYNNYQKDSSSGGMTGTFKNDILRVNYSFDSEGMHSDRELIFRKEGGDFIEGFGPVTVTDNKEVLKDISQVTYDSKMVFLKNENCIEHYEDSGHAVSFDYHAFFKAYEGDRAPTSDWRLNEKEKGIILGTVYVPSGFMPDTNFGSATLTVGRSTTPQAIANCSVGIPGDNVKKSNSKINGYDFKKFEFTEGAGGSMYETVSYRGIVDGDCYTVEYTIRSANIGNYSPEDNIKEFNKKEVVGNLEKILRSFKFLVNSD